MSDMRIDAGTTNIGKIGAGRPAAGGSPAQQAYDRAVKQMSDAQKKLAQDVAARAPEATITVDQAMVQAAALAVAAAAAALSQEQVEAQSAESPDQGQAEEKQVSRRDPYRLGDVDLHA
jgi:hypothetical protein